MAVPDTKKNSGGRATVYGDHRYVAIVGRLPTMRARGIAGKEDSMVTDAGGTRDETNWTLNPSSGHSILRARRGWAGHPISGAVLSAKRSTSTHIATGLIRVAPRLVKPALAIGS